MLLKQRQRRRGAVLVESALVYPVLFLTVFAILILSLAVFRHHQVTHIARECARWAAVHGSKYASDTGNAAATSADVTAHAKALAVGMRLGATDFSCATTWVNSSGGAATNDQSTNTVNASGTTVLVSTNYVQVVVTYTYKSGMFGNIVMTSTAKMPMSY